MKRKGRETLLRKLLYLALHADKFPGVSDAAEHGCYLFENREPPLDELFEDREDIKLMNLTPENRSELRNLRNAYIKIVEWEHDEPRDANFILDQATLAFHVVELANEQGVRPAKVYERMIRHTGRNPRAIKDMQQLDPFEGKNLDRFFVTDELRPVFGRLAERGLIR